MQDRNSQCKMHGIIRIALAKDLGLHTHTQYANILTNIQTGTDPHTYAKYFLLFLNLIVITKTRLFKINCKFHFIFLLKNIDCQYSSEPPWRGGSDEYPQSMFLSSCKKNNEYPCKPQFYHIKVGFEGVKII